MTVEKAKVLPTGSETPENPEVDPVVLKELKNLAKGNYKSNAELAHEKEMRKAELAEAQAKARKAEVEEKLAKTQSVTETINNTQTINTAATTPEAKPPEEEKPPWYSSLVKKASSFSQVSIVGMPVIGPAIASFGAMVKGFGIPFNLGAGISEAVSQLAKYLNPFGKELPDWEKVTLAFTQEEEPKPKPEEDTPREEDTNYGPRKVETLSRKEQIFGKLQKLIFKHESTPNQKYYTSSYDAYNNGVAGVQEEEQVPLVSQMTIKEIQEKQNPLRKPRLFVVGAYQISPDNLSEAVAYLKIDENEIFTKEIQDKIFFDYLLPVKRKIAYNFIMHGTGSMQEAQKALAKEWAAFGAGGKQGDKSYYDKGKNKGKNKASVSSKTFQNAIQDMQHIAQNRKFETGVDRYLEDFRLEGEISQKIMLDFQREQGKPYTASGDGRKGYDCTTTLSHLFLSNTGYSKEINELTKKTGGIDHFHGENIAAIVSNRSNQFSTKIHEKSFYSKLGSKRRDEMIFREEGKTKDKGYFAIGSIPRKSRNPSKDAEIIYNIARDHLKKKGGSMVFARSWKKKNSKWGGHTGVLQLDKNGDIIFFNSGYDNGSKKSELCSENFKKDLVSILKSSLEFNFTMGEIVEERIK